MNWRRFASIGKAALVVAAFVLGTSLGRCDDSDALATRYHAESVAARATWNGFPGFTAELSVRVDGVTAQGRLILTPGGDVDVEGVPERHREAATNALIALVARMRPDPNGPLDPCAFVEPENSARAFVRCADPFGVRYRIRDGECLGEEQSRPGFGLAVTNHLNHMQSAGKVLPGTFAVHSWDRAADQLLDTHISSHTWTRLGGFDLPTSVGTVTIPSRRGGRPDAPLAGSCLRLTLTDHQLFSPTSKLEAR